MRLIDWSEQVELSTIPLREFSPSRDSRKRIAVSFSFKSDGK